MLPELLSYLSELAIPAAWEHGHVRESIAIAARYKRCRAEWAEHLEKTKEAVLREAEKAEKHELAVILGSGPLFDVPLAELAGMFRRLVLIDIFHPRSARRAGACCPNVELLSLDILADDWREFLPQPDFVASLNIAAQLPLSSAIDGKRAIEKHLEGLSLIVTEKLRRKIDREGKIIEQEDALCGLALPAPTEQWLWKLAPYGEISPDWRLELEVIAYSPPPIKRGSDGQE